MIYSMCEITWLLERLLYQNGQTITVYLPIEVGVSCTFLIRNDKRAVEPANAGVV